jgi:FSR family fosmidomycin resistance protein-like MFS transporter
MAESKPAAYGAALPSVIGTVSERARPNVRLILLLALGHCVTDVNQGSLPALLPFLKAAHNLSYEAVGTIVLTANLTSSIVQPLFGYLSDRSARRWLLPVGIAVSGSALALTGVAPGYLAVLPLVLVMGFGVAAYHPEGYKAVTSVAGDRKATAISWFSLGGNVGVALGPPIMTALVTVVGLGGTVGMVVPSAIVAALFFAALPGLDAGPGARATALAPARGENMPGAMALLIGVVAVRSWTSLGFLTFVPLYYVDHLHADPRLVGPLLFVFLGAGALATVLAGPIADRIGARAFIHWVFLAAAPVAVLFVLQPSGVAGFVLLGLVGAVLTSSVSVSVVLAQAYLPRHAGMASGLIVGFAIGTGGLGVWLLGRVADQHGLPSALWISALLPLLGWGASMFLPAPRDRS